MIRFFLCLFPLFAISACRDVVNENPSSGYATPPGVRDQPPLMMKPSAPNLSRYIGRSIDSAIALAKAEGLSWRITGRDGISFPMTMDYSRNRLNFVLKKNRVVQCTRG